MLQLKANKALIDASDLGIKLRFYHNLMFLTIYFIDFFAYSTFYMVWALCPSSKVFIVLALLLTILSKTV